MVRSNLAEECIKVPGNGGRCCWPILEPTPAEKARTFVIIPGNCQDCRETYIAHLDTGYVVCSLLKENAEENITALTD